MHRKKVDYPSGYPCNAVSDWMSCDALGRTVGLLRRLVANLSVRLTSCQVDEAKKAKKAKKAKNRNKSKIRARVEHAFAVVKRLWGFDKVRYRGLAKNATRAFVTLALANIYLARRPLLAQVRA